VCLLISYYRVILSLSRGGATSQSTRRRDINDSFRSDFLSAVTIASTQLQIKSLLVRTTNAGVSRNAVRFLLRE